MTDHRPERRRRRTRAALACLALVVASGSLIDAGAVRRPTSFRDGFNELGPLPGFLPSDPYEIKRGDWEVVDLPDVLTFGNPRRVLRQNLKDGTPKEPIMFVRDTSFRQMSVQVTAALLDEIPGSSLGIVFRSPILEDRTADPDNLYLFSALNTGFVRGFPTGKAFALFKRVGEGYFMLDNRVHHTWADLSRPHDYKVTMVDGHIRAFVDGRLVIEHTDIPSPDVPTNADRLPGLPYHAGSVGLRTSNSRAWFDDLVIVADDAYEGRATAVEASFSYPLPSDMRDGVAGTLSNELDNLGLNLLDTGFVYADGDYEEAVIRAFEEGELELGASIRTFNDGETAVSVARAARVKGDITDPTERVTVSVDAAKIETSVTASCEASSSSVDLSSTTVSVAIASSNGAPDTVIGPIPLESSYKPNTKIYEQPGVVQIIAHRRIRSTQPHWVQASGLSIVFPNEELFVDEVNIGGLRVQPRTNLGSAPGAIIDIGLAVAGRYCAPMVESNT